MALTLHQLRTFLCLAEEGSIRATAERLYVSQPSVSATIGSLESELGIDLLKPAGRGVALTPEGEMLRNILRDVLGTLDAGLRAISDSGNLPPKLFLGVVTTAAETILLPAVVSFKAHHPDIEISVQVSNRRTIWQSLSGRSVDLVVGGRPPLGAPFKTLGIAPNELILVCSRTLLAKLGVRQSVSPANPASAINEPLEIASRVTWLMREEGSGTRAAAEELCEELGIRPPTMLLGSNAAIALGVKAGLGAALVARSSFHHLVSSGELEILPLPGTPLHRPWHLVAHARSPLSNTASLFAQELLQGTFHALE